MTTARASVMLGRAPLTIRLPVPGCRRRLPYDYLRELRFWLLSLPVRVLGAVVFVALDLAAFLFWQDSQPLAARAALRASLDSLRDLLRLPPSTSARIEQELRERDIYCPSWRKAGRCSTRCPYACGRGHRVVPGHRLAQATQRVAAATSTCFLKAAGNASGLLGVQGNSGMHAQLEATHPIGSPRRTVGWRALVLSVALALAASGVGGAPTIAITSPTASTLLKVRPTFVVTYAVGPTGAPPLDLASLRVTVNGADWTARFTTGSTQAAYAVAPADSLHAGDWTMEASIVDTTGARATTSRTYEVLPTPQTVKPSLAPERATLLLRVVGASESASQAFALFPSARGDAAGRVPFDSLDASTGEASVHVPDGALRGDVFVEVNGKRSLTGVPFVVQSPVPTCGAVRKALPLVDGGWVVHYENYGRSAYNAPWFDAQRCPDLIPHGCNLDRAVARIDPQGSAAILVQDSCGVFFQRHIEAVALDKAGREPAVLTTEVRAGVPQAQIMVHVGEHAFAVPGLGWLSWGLAADFDARGRLLLAVHDGDLHLNLLRLNLPDGDQVPEVVARQLEPDPPIVRPGHPPEPSTRVEDLAVRCDGQAFLGLNYRGSEVGDYGMLVRRVDASTGVVLGDSGRMVQVVLNTLAQSCHQDEVWVHGTSQASVGGESTGVWHVPVLPDGGLGGFEPRWTHAGLHTRGVSVGGDGGVRASFGPWPPGAGPFVRLDGVTPCTQAGVTTAAPYCPVLPLTILPARSTRWRPRRATAGGIEVFFQGPRDLTSATMTILGPDGAPIANPLLAFERVSAPDVEPAEYRLTWSGPWRVAAPEGGEDFRPAGAYRVRLQGELSDGHSVARSAWYDKLALVEVQAVELSAAPGAPELSANPAVSTLPGQDPPQGRPGGGLRIFAEQATADGPLFDRALVRVTTTPVLGPDDAIPLERATVRVHLRAFDVDDPMPYLPDLDEDRDATVQDNRGLPAIGTLRDAYVDVLPGTNSAETEWTLTHQPGDNFRVAASTAAEWLASLRAVQPSTSGELSYAGPEVSPMLTVWRTLHIEADSMAPPPTEDMPADAPGYAERNFIKGRVLRISVDGPTLALDAALPSPMAYEPRYAYLEPEATEPALTLGDGSRDLAEGQGGRFEHGRMQVGGPADACWVLDLDGNGVDSVTGWEYVRSIATPPESSRLRLAFVARRAGLDDVAGFVMAWDASPRRMTLDQPLSSDYIGGTLDACGQSWTIAGIAGEDLTVVEDRPLTFVLWDDDATPWPYTVSSQYLTDSDDATRNSLAQAYVRPRWDLASSVTTPPFMRGLWARVPWDQAKEAAAQTQLRTGREWPTSLLFWTSYFQGSFQSSAGRDSDPDDESSELAWTLHLSDEFGAFVGLEQVRDVSHCQRPDQLSHTVLHELGHQLGLDHEPGDVMEITDNVLCRHIPDWFKADNIAHIRNKGAQP